MSILLRASLALCMASLILVTTYCSHAPVDQDKGSAKWSSNMHELSEVLSTLFPYLMSKEEFNSEKNYAEIERNVKRLAELAHNVKENMSSPDKDPTVKFLAKDFDSEINRAHNALVSGNKQYARNVLAVATNHCVGCHSRSQMGPQFGDLNLKINYEELNPFVRAETYLATRQFKKSVEEYNTIATRKDLIAEYPFEVERSLKKALTVYVRVFDDVEGGLRLVENFLKVANTPPFLKRQAVVWQKDLKDWKKEAANGKTLRGEVLVKNMEALVSESNKRGENAFIGYLRASSLGHIFLSKFDKDPRQAEILFNMGVCYESLQDLGYWSLSEDYYTQCIREKPHSPVAKKCYEQLEESIQVGYTGSIGTNIPKEVRDQLSILKGLAL